MIKTLFTSDRQTDWLTECLSLPAAEGRPSRYWSTELKHLKSRHLTTEERDRLEGQRETDKRERGTRQMGDRKIYRYSHSCLPRPVGPVPFWISGPFFSPRWLQQVTPHRRTLAPPPAVTHTLPIIPGGTAKNQSEVSLFSRVPQFEQNSQSMIGWEIRGDYLGVIGCGSREGGAWKGDVGVVRQAVDRKWPPLQDRQETVHALSQLEAYAELHVERHWWG